MIPCEPLYFLTRERGTYGHERGVHTHLCNDLIMNGTRARGIANVNVGVREEVFSACQCDSLAHRVGMYRVYVRMKNARIVTAFNNTSYITCLTIRIIGQRR
jgi:hypothetical protein